jgi:hypothetical protein
VNNLVRHRLRGAPRLISAHLRLLNRGRRKAWRDSLLGFGLIIVWAVIAALLLFARHGASASSLAWMYRHRLLLASVAAVAAAVLVSRRRTLRRAEAVRSWLSALPVDPVTARWEALAIETAPAVGAMCVSTLAFGIVGAIAVFAPGISEIELLAVWITINAGIIAGASAGYLVPAPKAIDLPPGSRYVPHHRVVGAASPIPRLSALGQWPVRQMFASARPKAVARGVMPILLLMPLGSSADTAMLVIAMFVVLGAVLVLVVATISVSKASCRWLLPLPLKIALLAFTVLIRPLAVILGTTSVAAWLFWVMGAGAGQSVVRGALLMILSSCVAVGGSLGAIHRITKGRW